MRQCPKGCNTGNAGHPESADALGQRQERRSSTGGTCSHRAACLLNEGRRVAGGGPSTVLRPSGETAAARSGGAHSDRWFTSARETRATSAAPVLPRPPRGYPAATRLAHPAPRTGKNGGCVSGVGVEGWLCVCGGGSVRCG